VYASPRLKLLFTLLLGLSVSGKVISHSLRGTEQMMQNTEISEIAAFLGRHGFQVGEAQPDFPFVPAAVAGCHLLIASAAPEGWHRDITRRLASPQDQAFFVFDGVVYQDQPAWRPWLYSYWRELNLGFGRALPARPVVGIVASPACALRDMPWQELAELR
jgi:hypothetical protein